MIEFWDGTTRVKYEYEMRYGPDGQVQRNGWARAYYSNGSVEREGAYLDGARAGTWTYYTPEGKIDRSGFERGQPVWSGPGQLKAVPGTEQ